LDVNKKIVCSDTDILLLARKRPATQARYKKTLTELSMMDENLLELFAVLFGAAIFMSVESFPDKK